eukprot:1150364-Pelagomonas_calceolata.AAC.1
MCRGVAAEKSKAHNCSSVRTLDVGENPTKCLFQCVTIQQILRLRATVCHACNGQGHQHIECPCIFAQPIATYGCHEASSVCGGAHASFAPGTGTAIVPGKKPGLLKLGDPRSLRNGRRIDARQAAESDGL